MDISKPIILCGSGASIPFLNSRYNSNGFKHGLEPKLEEIIKSNYSIGLNFWFQFGCKTTFCLSGDFQFYEDNKEKLKNLPLIIASADPQLKNQKVSRIHDNTILLPNAGIYFGKDSWEKGFYTKQLIGIYAITVAIALGFTEIYLLGYDCIEINGQTHFYQGVANLDEYKDIYVDGKLKDQRYQFRGVGKTPENTYKTSTYNHVNHINNQWFAPFHAERKKLKIYNVSINSVINTFPKISYDAFFQQITDNHIDQIQARKEIKEFVLQKL